MFYVKKINNNKKNYVLSNILQVNREFFYSKQ